MGLFVVHLLQIGMLVAGTVSKSKDITADGENELNTRSAVSLDSVLGAWEPSTSGVLKRSEASQMDVGTAILLHGRETRSVTKHPRPGSTQKPHRVTSKHKQNVRHKLRTKTGHARKNSQHLKPGYRAKPQARVKSGQRHVAKNPDASKHRKGIAETKHARVQKWPAGGKKSTVKHSLNTKQRKFTHLAEHKKSKIKQLPQTRKRTITHLPQAKKHN